MNPFEVARLIGTNLNEAVVSSRDKKNISNILNQFSNDVNPESENLGINEILSNVSPGRQQEAIQALSMLRQNAMQQQQQQQQQKYYESQGYGEGFQSLPSEERRVLMQQKGKSAESTEREQQILAKKLSGEKLTPEEYAELSPTSQRSILAQEKPTFEPTEDRLEAERVSKLADEISREYEATRSENMRLDRMESLDKEGNLSTPAMVTTLNKFGLPLGILGNPDSEEYAKLEADFLRDVRNVFPGGRITNYEVQAYLRTVPGLLNTPEGRKSIVKNRRLFNEARKIRYETYKEILKENNGRKPRNLDLLINERSGDKMAEIEEQFSQNMDQSAEKFQQPIRMKDANGQLYDIPPGKIQQALENGFKF